MKEYLSIIWEVVKVAIIPVCIWYFEHKVQERDDRLERLNAERKRELEEAQQKDTDVQFLMMERIDSLSEMTQLMANKLHEAGIINGDLEELKRKYQIVDDKYEKHIKALAAEVLRR